MAVVLSCIVSTFLFPAKAEALQTFLFNFDKLLIDGDPVRIEGGRLRITTESTRSTVNGFSGYLMRSITGTDEGNEVTALLPAGFFDPLLSGLPTDNLFNPSVGSPPTEYQFSGNGFAYAVGDRLYQFYFGEYELPSRSRFSPLEYDYRGIPCIKNPNALECRERARRPEIISVETIPVPTPGPLPLLGLGAAYGYSRKLRKRVQSRRTPAGMTSIKWDQARSNNAAAAIQP
ncbi:MULTISPECIES: hypothetical protein [unclassified Cyanobium]|uniref:hypothetical protein n=1 Tax=unclassified Cyanobium TaxID=2627006 RepID=UPI0020CCC258|nr:MULTISPECIES: hypothetical protein [unclassified Cyanobium]MCP9858559.1 hypothetical protein [Cyanobium sp. Cruz-8H5]MCP9865784.1 hypothetical protein [Cyanobium sp. Cruz-8D1]